MFLQRDRNYLTVFISPKKYVVNEMENLRTLIIQNKLSASQEKFGQLLDLYVFFFGSYGLYCCWFNLGELIFDDLLWVRDKGEVLKNINLITPFTPDH